MNGQGGRRARIRRVVSVRTARDARTGAITIEASGEAGSTGWTDPQLEMVLTFPENAVGPDILLRAFTAIKPQFGEDTLTPIAASAVIEKPSAGVRLVRVLAETNTVDSAL